MRAVDVICIGRRGSWPGCGTAISDLKPNCHPGPFLPEINGSYQRCPPNSSQRMGPSLFSNCVKILWNLKEIAQSNDDGSFGVNMEYYVIRVNTDRHLFKHMEIKGNDRI